MIHDAEGAKLHLSLKKKTEIKKPPHTSSVLSLLLRGIKRPYLQHRALLEAKAILEQTSDVGQVHAQEGAGGRGLGHLIAHWDTQKSGS